MQSLIMVWDFPHDGFGGFAHRVQDTHTILARFRCLAFQKQPLPESASEHRSFRNAVTYQEAFSHEQEVIRGQSKSS